MLGNSSLVMKTVKSRELIKVIEYKHIFLIHNHYFLPKKH